MSGFAVGAEVRVSATDGDEVTLYPVIAEPLLAPAVYGIEMVVKPELVTVTDVGAAGEEYGITFTLPEAALIPIAFAAVTETE